MAETDASLPHKPGNFSLIVTTRLAISTTVAQLSVLTRPNFLFRTMFSYNRVVSSRNAKEGAAGGSSTFPLVVG